MGHVESGGATEPGDDAGLSAERVWALWRRLKRFFPAWSLLPSAFYTPGAWTMIGIDMLGGFRRRRSICSKACRRPSSRPWSPWRR